MTEPIATCQPTEYEVSILPDDDINYPVFVLTVQNRGNDRWAVVRHQSCLGADGTWDFGIKEYDRGEAWLNAHRFTLDEALRLAKEAAPHVVVNGHTATDAYERAVAAAADQPAIGRTDAEAVAFGDSRVPADFWARVEQSDNGCWTWKLKPQKGYGRYKSGGAYYTAHRFIYEMVVGPIPEGMQVDHVCHSLDPTCEGGYCLHRMCVNPMHLEAVSSHENARRAVEMNRSESCPQGHPYNLANIRFTSKGVRFCRACQRASAQARRAAK